MRTLPLSLSLCIVVSAALMTGCGGSKSEPQAGTGEPAKPVMPQTETALATAAEETKKAVSEAAATVKETAKTAVSDITSKFISMAKAQGDNVLNSIGQDLGAKVQSLTDSCGANPSVKTNLDNTLGALLNGKDGEALAPAFQASQGIGLTTQQVQLAKEVGNLASAFVVQRNFSSLQGAQGDVAKLVTSLRNGEYGAALPPLQAVMNNASLTAPQKEILGTLADKYAPAVRQAAGTLQKGLQTLQGLPGAKK